MVKLTVNKGWLRVPGYISFREGRMNQQHMYKTKPMSLKKWTLSSFLPLPLMYSEQESQGIDIQCECAPQPILPLSSWLFLVLKLVSRV